MYNYNFCSNCGEKFKKISETFYLCPSCNFRIFLDPKPSASAFIFNNQGQVLLLKRANDPGKGMWGMPGGAICLGENAPQAALREIKEETGLSVENLNYFGSFAGDYLHKDIVYKIVNTVYTAKLPTDKRITLSGESLEYAFFDIDKIPVGEIVLEDVKKAVKLLLVEHKNGKLFIN